jgi:hypothetical protein
VNAKSLAGGAAIAFMIWWIIKEPMSAAHLVTNIVNFLAAAANGLSHAVHNI